MKKRIDTARLLPPFEELVSVKVLKSMIIRPEALEVVKRKGEGENLYIFVGSSGAGRDTIMDECLAQIKGSVRLRRTTTRKPREYIKDKDLRRMLFITEKAFVRDFKKGEILFAGRYKANQKLYGIGRGEVLKLAKRKKSPHLLEANFSGLPLKVMLPKSKLIVVFPPTAAVLKDRLFSRDKSEKECRRRFKTSLTEIKALLADLNKMIKERTVDMVVINEGFPKDVGERVARAIINGRRLIDDSSLLKRSMR